MSTQLGVGDLRVSFGEYMISGRTFPIGLQIGLAAASNLVIFTEIYEAHVFSPISNRNELASLNLYGLGPGLKYYFSPSNLFLTGSLLLSRLGTTTSTEWGSASDTSHWGTMERFSIGKEWWISPTWSLGLAGEVLFGQMHSESTGSEGLSDAYVTRAFSLLLSGGFSYPPSYSSGRAPSATEPGASADNQGAPWVHSAKDRTHDGFYLSARLGPGWLWVIPKRRVSYEDTHRTSGLGYPFAISAGLAFKRSLVLFGEFYRAVILDPSTPGDLAAFALQGFGPGLKYYRMSSNIFVAGSLLCARATMHNRYGGDYRVPTNISTTSPWGVTALLSAGREWWISADWGLGIAGEFLLGRTAWYTAAGGSLLVSASFN